MCVRIPGWTSEASFVSINGERLDASAMPGSYLNVSRIWRAGDRVELSLPMKLTVEPLPDDPTLQAFLYGPIVLAGQLPLGELSEKLLRENQGPEV